MRFRLQNCLILVLVILLNTCLLPAPVFAKVTQAQVGARGAEQNRGQEEIELGGWWKMDKIRPGQGVEEGYHNFPQRALLLAKTARLSSFRALIWQKSRI